MYDFEAIRRSGFKIIEQDMIRYEDDKFAEDYLNWGFDAPEEKAAEVSFFLENSGLGPGSSIVDIACGNGVSSVRLAERGISVTAIDISPVFIEAGRKLEQESTGEVAINWRSCDFFEFQCEPHDAAILLDPGLPTAIHEFAAKVSGLLKPGGVFFLRYKDGITARMMNLPQYRWSCPEGQAVFTLERHHFEQATGKFVDEWIVIDFGAKTIQFKPMERRAVLFPDFVDLMASHGLMFKGSWGDSKGALVTENSRLYALFMKI